MVILKGMNHDKLLRLLQKKRSFFEAILDLSQEENSLPFTDWISVLEQKKVLLSCIDDIDTELTPFKATLHHLSQDVTDELAKIRSIVKTILDVDSQNQEWRRKTLYE